MIRYLAWICLGMSIAFANIDIVQKEFWFIWISVFLVLISHTMRI
jgi:hypothetical protein